MLAGLLGICQRLVVRCRWAVAIDVDGAEPVDRFLEALAEIDGGVPPEVFLG